jgi:outer membrane protein OmpA-like peptidoglycan-associated protein
MASKKYSILFGVLCLMASAGFSQVVTVTGYDAADSSIVPSRRLPQYTEFMNGTYNYPPKPRNQWELGLKVGAFTISGDVPALFPTPGFGFHLRKALGYVVSMRLDGMYGIGKGLHFGQALNYGKNPAWSAYNAPRGITDTRVAEPVYYNYRTSVKELSLNALFSLNNILFHKARTRLSPYFLVGAGPMTYESEVNALNGSAKYNFGQIQGGGVYENRKETRDRLKDLMDDSYETPAENQGERRPKLFGETLKWVGHVGLGIQFKLSDRMNIALEDKFSITKDDLLDGQRWQEHPRGDAVLTRDYDAYNFLSLGLNFNIGQNAVQPLWWLNPLDYAYSEIRNPRLMRLPTPVLPDSDGDGVTDQFDLEETPPGCPVDTHGVSLDTDGDGVPDCRDKEKITPTHCQPVDADGVGKCPCPEGCGTGTGGAGACANALGALPSITFSGNTVAITSDARSMLASVAARMRNNPECRVVVVGYCSSTKTEQQRSWDRVNAVINYLVEREGVSADRFIFSHAQEGGDCNTVDLRAAAEGEEGPNTVPAPHPNLRRNR